MQCNLLFFLYPIMARAISSSEVKYTLTELVAEATNIEHMEEDETGYAGEALTKIPITWEKVRTYKHETWGFCLY